MSGVEPKVAVATNINPKLVGGSSSTSTKYGGVKKIETLTLSELNAYITSPHRYCNEESKMIFVYEYMKKGTLKDHLASLSPYRFRKSHYTLRVKSASGKHSCWSFVSVNPGPFRGKFHGNVLKGDNRCFLVLYLLMVSNQTHVSTMVKGSFGYLDPDYYVGAQIDPSIPSEK
ncbi:unnamed protein product, partial [Brassica oleracea]